MLTPPVLLAVKRVFVTPNKVLSLSDMGELFIKQWEKLELEAYPDTGGVWTIGWGTTKNVKQGMKITREKAQEFFKRDIEVFEKAVRKYINVPLLEHQFDMLVSFSYNVGEEALRVSTLRRLLNMGKYEEVPGQLKRWIYDNGKVVNGLVNRRNAEAKVWTEGYY